MKRSLLIALALLVLPFSLVVSSGTANAAVETEKSLNARLLTDSELKDVFAAIKVPYNFTDSVDLKDSDLDLKDIVGSGRLWLAADGSGLADVLLSYRDGRAIPADDRKSILKGDFAKSILGELFTKVELIGELEVLSENDIMHGFEGTDADGKVFQVAVVSFTRGNIFGVVFYATGDNQLVEAAAAFGGQSVKLPK